MRAGVVSSWVSSGTVHAEAESGLSSEGNARSAGRFAGLESHSAGVPEMRSGHDVEGDRKGAESPQDKASLLSAVSMLRSLRFLSYSSVLTAGCSAVDPARGTAAAAAAAAENRSVLGPAAALPPALCSCCHPSMVLRSFIYRRFDICLPPGGVS